uniref:centrosomal protein cep290 n=1 Tax=Erigeron canadensis TaxID=72917 RepID=UPI001CB88EA4|nr:centrosomal protein cep290 [Erigeron canadensis]
MKKPHRRKTSPLSWFPRKKGDSYLTRKLKLLQEVDGMNSTLDETLGDTNPHFSKVLKEKMAVREAAHRAIEARRAALVEASWCRILRAARIESKEAEDLLVKAEKTATEAFESANEIGVIMYDIQDLPRKHCKIETSAVNGGESTTHKVTTSFDTAFEVDKQVASAVKAAFVRLSTCASIGKQEFKEILKKISENPDLDEHCQDLYDSAPEYDSDVAPEFESDSHKSVMELSKEKQRENLVDMMFQRLKCLQEEELASLATIVATCGLNAALAKAENGINDGKVSCKEELPGLDKFLVKRMTRLEKEIQDARNARTKETSDKDKKISKEPEASVTDLGSMLTKRTSKLEKEIEESKRKFGNEYEPKGKKSERLKNEMKDVPSLDQVLVKRVSRLEREVQEAKKQKENVDTNKERSKENELNADNRAEGLDSILVKHVSKLEKEKMAFRDTNEDVKVKRKDRKSDLEHGEGSLDQILVKHKSRLEREKVAVAVEQPVNEMKNPLVAKREARERELQEAWGGVSFGNSVRPHVSRLQKDKAAWLKAEEEERKVAKQGRAA